MELLSFLCARRCWLCYVVAFCTLHAIFNLWYSRKRDHFLTKANGFEISTITTKPVIIHWTKLPNDLNCHYSLENDVLVSVDSPGFLIGKKTIFFHETSCRGGIVSRQACAVESAARLHPDWQVHLLFSSPITEQILRNSSLTKLIEFQNVRLARLHITQYGQDTVVEDILKNRLKGSSHPMEHTSDILRILTLHKFGGVYLDTDSILVKNLEELPPNWIGKESADEIASGAMAFSKDGFGRNLTTAILTELRDTFDPHSWSYNGPQAIKRVLQRWCPDAFKFARDCYVLKIFTPEYFYPVHYSKRQQYFENGDIDKMALPYMHHMWNYLTKDLKIKNESPYAKLARQFCPTIYEMYGNEFGN